MIKFNLQLLPEAPGDHEVSKGNELAEKSYNHLVGLIGGIRCKKHPSFKNVMNIIAVKGKDPKVEVKSICCQDFHLSLGH